MLSSNKNIQSITQLIENFKEYLSLEKECLKFDITDKLVRIVTSLIVFVSIFVLSIGVLLYMSFACVFWLAQYVGWFLSFSIMAGVFLFAIILVLCNRKKWIERPLTRFFAGIILK